jgi:glucose dehydrogenase
MKSKLKKIALSIILLISIISLAVLFDMAQYDASYINKKSISFNKKNINSKKVLKIFHFYEDYFFSSSSKKNLKVESKNLRNSKPSTKIIKKKTDDFLPGSTIEQVEKNFSNWKRSHGGFSSSRFSSLKLINKKNINQLELAWIYNSKDGKKGMQANPIVYEGFIYSPTPGNHIVCLDGTNGKEVWRYKAKKGYNVAKRGLLIWNDKKNNIDKLFFTNDDELISLNAKTGVPIKSFGKNGIINIGSSPIPPVIIDKKLIVATFRPSIEVYDIFSGKLDWKYYLRNLDKKIFNKDFSGGNPWGGISADTKNGMVFLTTGNPKPLYVGVSRPGKNLFANSIIGFDVRNKKKVWHFQETCHDLWNLDIAAPPILTTINRYDKRIDVVIAVTKLGNTIILDRYSGVPIFDYKMKLAPTSSVPGEKTCEYQTALTIPEPFAKNEFTINDVTDLNEESRNFILSIVNKSKYGFFATPDINKDSIQFGDNGGAQWTGASVDPYNNILYVTANNIPWIVGLKEFKKGKKIKYLDKKAIPLRDENGYPGSKPPWGTLTAINLNTGKIIWQVPLGFYEELKNKGLITGTENFGGATATLGGLVFAGGTMDKMFRAFDSDTGKELWSYKLPFIGSAPPTSYEINNEQYIVIPASGGTTLKIYYNDIVELGDAIVAFKIKK